MGPQSAGLIITLGFGSGTATDDTHDDGAIRRHTEATRRRDEEYRRQREELRSQLLSAVERVTGKPPPLDQSLKQLASLARRSEGFDYQQALRDIEAIESMRAQQLLGEAKSMEEPAAIDDENVRKILLLLTIL